MTSRKAGIVLDQDEDARSPLWRWAKIVGASTLALFAGGMVAGYLAAHFEDGGSFDAAGLAVLGVLVLIAAGSLWLLLRVARRPAGEAPATPREALNRNILIACGLLGGLMAAFVMIGSPEGIDGSSMFDNSPLPRGLAIALVVVTGVLVPLLSIHWHRNATDEQEEDAYKTGALYGIYVYWTLAPAWWFAWRGGLTGEPNGVVIFMATVCTVGIIWTWKKYR